MSSEASDWAWRQRLAPTQKLVLLAMADGADFDGTYGGKMPHLRRMTGLDARSILHAIMALQDAGLASWGGEGVRSKLHLAVRA